MQQQLRDDGHDNGHCEQQRRFRQVLRSLAQQDNVQKYPEDLLHYLPIATPYVGTIIAC